MSKLNEKYEVDRKFLKCDSIGYTPSELNTLNAGNSQVSINIPRENSVNSLLNSYLNGNFDGLHASTNNRYLDG